MNQGLRAATSDWHLLGLNNAEPCDRKLVLRLVAECIRQQVEELLILGDLFDRTRGEDDEVYTFFVEAVLKVLATEGIYTTLIWGNHEGDYDAASKIARTLFSYGADPKLFRFSTGPEYRGKFRLEHGHRLDPWCSEHGSFRTTIGEMFTRFDHWGDHIGIDLEKINPTNLPIHIDCKELDLPIHQKFNLDAGRNATHLICGHSHVMYKLISEDWSIHNTGALTKGHGLEYILFDDKGDIELIHG